MSRKYRNSGWLAIALLLTAARSDAQFQPTTTVAVDSVLKAGIYRIVLPPPFVARSRTDLSDLRIFDEAQKETPYVLRTELQDPLNAGYQPIPDPKIVEKDSSNHHSYYKLKYNDSYRIDRLSFVIRSPALYKRMAFVTSNDNGQIGVQASISIDPRDTVIHLRPMKGDNLIIDVDNEDNEPLAITRVATAQAGIYLLTYLEPQHSYALMAGDPAVAAPEYDLHYFTDSTRMSPVTIGLGPIERVEWRVKNVNRNPRLEQADRKSRQVLLWSLVLSILLFLLYVSVKLAKAVNKKESE
jgi:hypothetical protein